MNSLTWQTVQQLVLGLDPMDDLETQHRSSILGWLQSTQDIFRRVRPDIPRQHLAVFAVPVDLMARRLLLGRHRNAGRWLPPGGHVDAGESPTDAAHREVREELGQALPLLRTPPVLMSIDETVGSIGAHIDVSIWYAFRGDAASAVTLCTDEFEDTAWMSFDDVPTLATNLNLPRFIQKLERTFPSVAA